MTDEQPAAGRADRARRLVPDFSPALRELRALALDNEDLPIALDHFSQTGLPLLVCEIDHAATATTGDLVFSYKLSDQLQVSLAAVRVSP